jgi:peroxiredoxin
MTSPFVQRHLLALALWLILSGAAPKLHAASSVGDFALLDQHGDFHRLSSYKGAKALVVAVLPPSEDKTLISAYQALAAEYRGKGFVFVGLRIGEVNDRDELRRRLSNFGVTFPVLLDDSESVAELLGLTLASEVLLLDPESQIILFRGPMGRALNVALGQRAAAAAVEPAVVAVQGTPLPKSNARLHWRNPNGTSYSKEVAQLLIKNCVACHRLGGIAPFAMDSWAVVKGWSPMIKEVLLTKRMPPGQVDPDIGDFKNGRALSRGDLATLVRWIDAGAPRDGDRDPLAEIPKRDEAWAFGMPDKSIELPPQTIPAAGPLGFSEVIVPFGLPKDKWLRASQFMPGDKRVLHHAELFIASKSSATSQSFGLSSSLPSYYGVGNPEVASFLPYVPGDEPTEWPDNSGGRIAKDSSLVVQLHYGTIGRDVHDKSRLGLWFYDDATPPTARLTTECVCLQPAQWKAIPPLATNFKAQATLVLRKAAYLYTVQPRMHYRGSAIRLVAEHSSGAVEPLLNVPNYSYSWQMNYQFRVPRYFPAGTKLIANARYDNSSHNMLNPDPTQAVMWGRNSSSEELAVVLRIRYVD